MTMTTVEIADQTAESTTSATTLKKPYPIHLATDAAKKSVVHDADLPELEVLHEQRRWDEVLEVEKGVFIEYDVYGFDSAPEKIVFVMGFIGLRQEWASVINDIFLADYNRYQVLVVDNRGAGGSSAPAGRYTTLRMAQDVLAVIDRIGWQRFHLAGISMGGMISQELALLARERLDSLTLLVTHAGGVRALPGFPQLEGYTRLSTVILAARSLKSAANGLFPSFFTDNYLESVADDGTGRLNNEKRFNIMEARARYIPLHEEEAAAANPNYVKKGSGTKALRWTGLMGQLSAITTHRLDYRRCSMISAKGFPVLLVGASKDKIIHVRNSRAIKKKLLGGDKDSSESTSNVTYVEVESGHVVNTECPDLVCERLLETITKGSEWRKAHQSS